MAQPLKFTVATPADVPALLPLVRSAYRGEESRQGWTTEADLLTGERIDTAGMLAKVADPNGVILLVRDPAGVLVGCCELLRSPGSAVAYFGLFAVSPHRQGAGLGRQVLEWAERYARDSWAAKVLEMNVIWKRVELIEWYQRRGYRKTGEARPFPYELLLAESDALRDDLHFEVLAKSL